jgi:5-oxoprolinase (ATP-hydrolysing) subunit A
MPHITSVNVACGGHAGDEVTMKATIEQAARWKLAIGAHPGYPDRANFGRIELEMAPEAIAESVFEQVSSFGKIAAACGIRVTHVKPHGALYNQAARDTQIAEAIADGVARWNRTVVLIGLAGSEMVRVFREEGFRVACEAFADRRYEPDGSLRARKFEDALLRDPEEAARQALRIVENGTVIASDGSAVALDAQTICIHGDTDGAKEIAAAVAAKLRGASVELRPVTD